MRHVDRIDFVYRLLPFPSWKDALLRRHIEKCPACGGHLVSRDETRRILTQADEVGDLAGMWPAVRAKIMAGTGADAPRLERAPARAWRWAVVFAGLGLAIFMAFAVIAYFRTGRVSANPGAGSSAVAESTPTDVSLFYVRIGNEPARTLVFKPRGSNMIIVWAEKNQ